MKKYRVVLFVIVRILCWVGFLYQMISVTKSYLQYNTTTKIDYGNNKNILVPSFSLAFPLYVPIRKLLQKLDPNYDFQVMQQVQQFKIPKTNLTIREPDEFVLINDLINKIYQNYTSEQLFLATDMSEYIRNFSISYCALPSNVSNHVIDAFGPKSLRSITFLDGRSESINCRLMHETSRIMVQFNNGDIMPYIPTTSYAFTMHSSEATPHYQQMQFLKTERRHFVTYNIISIKRLKAPYHTNCQNYGEEFASHGSQSTCVSRCVFERMVKCDNYKNNDDFAFDEDYVRQSNDCQRFSERNYNKLFCYPTFFYKTYEYSKALKMPRADAKVCVDLDHDRYLRIEDSCYDKCLDDCDQTIYSKKVYLLI